MTTDRRTRFERLFALHYEPVLAYALRRAPAAEAHDVAADTFLVAWRRLDAVPADALPWLYGVARRTLANHRRAHRRREALVERLAAEPERRGGEDDGAVLAALARLPEALRETVLLVAWEGLDRRRAASALGCSPLAVSLRLHRARRRLAAELGLEPGPAVPREEPS